MKARRREAKQACARAAARGRIRGAAQAAVGAVAAALIRAARGFLSAAFACQTCEKKPAGRASSKVAPPPIAPPGAAGPLAAGSLSLASLLHPLLNQTSLLHSKQQKITGTWQQRITGAEACLSLMMGCKEGQPTQQGKPLRGLK